MNLDSLIDYMYKNHTYVNYTERILFEIRKCEYELSKCKYKKKRKELENTILNFQFSRFCNLFTVLGLEPMDYLLSQYFMPSVLECGMCFNTKHLSFILNDSFLLKVEDLAIKENKRYNSKMRKVFNRIKKCEGLGYHMYLATFTYDDKLLNENAVQQFVQEYNMDYDTDKQRCISLYLFSYLKIMLANDPHIKNYVINTDIGSKYGRGHCHAFIASDIKLKKKHFKSVYDDVLGFSDLSYCNSRFRSLRYVVGVVKHTFKCDDSFVYYSRKRA